GRQAQHADGDAEDDPDRRQLRAEVVHERRLEDAERIDLADREVDCEGGWWNQPAVVAAWSDRTLPIEERQHATGPLPPELRCAESVPAVVCTETNLNPRRPDRPARSDTMPGVRRVLPVLTLALTSLL